MNLFAYILSTFYMPVFAQKSGKWEEPKIVLVSQGCELTSTLKNTAECANVYSLCTHVLSKNVMLRYSCPLDCCFDTKILRCICEEAETQKTVGRKFSRIGYSESKGQGQRGSLAGTTQPWWINSSTARPPVSGKFECPDDMGDGYMDEYPDPNDCQYFWVCYTKDIMVRYKCGDHQYFNGDECIPGQCPDANPGAKPLDPNVPGCKVKQFKCPTNEHHNEHPDPNDCNFYFECHKMDIISRKRCPNWEHFEDGNCVEGECPSTIRDWCQRDCQVGSFECPEDRVDEFPLYFADPNDCNYFHICYRIDKAWRLSCGPEAHFDGDWCVEKWCPDAIPGCEPLNPPGTLPSTTTTWKPTSTGITTTTTSRPPHTGYFKCPDDDGDGYPNEYPDPNDCRYFWICYSDDLMARYDCGGGWYFNGDECDEGVCPDRIPGAQPLDPKPTKCPISEFACPDVDYGSKHQDPNDCNFYFTCEHGYILRRDQCDDGEHFEGGDCLDGSCPTSVRDCGGTTEIPTTTTLKPCLTGKFECPKQPPKGYVSYADPNDCRYWFKCYSNGPYRQDCGAGGHFKDGQCAAGSCPDSVPNCKPLDQDRECLTGYFECPQGGPDGGIYLDRNDCRYYLVCLESGTVKRDCGKGKHFNLDGDGRCSDGECPSRLPNCEPQVVEPPKLTTMRPCLTGKFECPSKPPNGYLAFVDPNNCRYWYACYSNGAYREDCGVEWHYEGGKCVPGACPTALPDCKPLDQGRECWTDPFECPPDSDWKLYKDKNDCRFYFRCAYGNADRLDCGPGRHYKSGKCHDGDCSFKLPGCKPQEIAPSKCVTGTFECPERPSSGWKQYKDPNDCRYYYDCYDTGAYRQDCGEGQHFDGKKCVTGTCPGGLPDCKPLEQGRECWTDHFQCPPGAKWTLYHDQNDCRFYFRCNDKGVADRLDCGPGRHYKGGQCHDGDCSFKLPGCKPQEIAPSKCVTGTFECPERPSSGWKQYKDPNDCRYYYDCYDTGAYRQDCGEGQHFEVNKCIPGNCPGALPDCTPLQQGRECSTKPFVCPQGSDGRLYHDQNDCRFYFYCANYVAQRIDCGAGKHWQRDGKCHNGDCSYKLPGCKPQEPAPGPSGRNLQRATTPSTKPPVCYVKKFKCRTWAVIGYPVDCGAGRHFKNGRCIPGPCPRICRYKN